MGTEPCGPCAGHGGMDAEPAGFIRAGSHDTTAVWPASDDNRLALEVGVVALFNGSKKSVHVDMYDFPLTVHADRVVE